MKKRNGGTRLSAPRVKTGLREILAKAVGDYWVAELRREQA
jgi:hypothetical protein